MKNIIIVLVLTLFLAVTADAQRTADFRRLSLENGNAAQKSWLISTGSSLGIDEVGNVSGTFPNTATLVTMRAGTKTNALELQSLLGGTGILFSQNIPSVGIDMLLGASGTGIIIDGGTPVGITIGNATAGSDGMTIDATNSGISIGNGTAPNNGMNIEAISTGLAIGTATTPDIGQTTEANITGGTFDAGIIGVDIGQNTSPTLGLGVRSNGTGINVNENGFFGTGINLTMNSFIGTGLNIQDNTFSGTGINVSAGVNSTGINVSGTTNNILVVNGTADATLLSVGADPVWDARINGDLHVTGETKFGGSIYVDGMTPNNHSILANDDLTLGTNAAGQQLNLVTGAGGNIVLTPGAGGIVNIGGPIMFPALPSLSNLDMGNFRILNIGNAGTDFTAAGGLILADKLTIGNITALSGSLNVLVSNAGVVEQRTAASIIAATAWALNGNALTGVLPASPIERFGSTNGADVIMMTGGNEQMRLRSTGGINIPTTTNAGVGAIYQNGVLFIHSYGTQQFFAGAGAGNFGVSGVQNTGVGAAALNAVGAGQQNTALGYSALRSNIGGSYNTAVGLNAMQNNIAGNWNVAVGLGALLNSNQSANTAVGFEAMNAAAGADNVAVGYRALYVNTVSDNTAVGSRALMANTTGANNTSMGVGSLTANTAGGHNAAFGRDALSATQGNFNTGVGSSTGATNTTGTNNTFVGYSANASASGLTNATAIGANAVVSQNDALILGNNAQVGIKNSAPTADLDVNGTVRIRNLSTVYTNLVTANASGNLGNNTAIGLGLVTGTGTTNTIPKWTTSTGALGNSLLSDNATSLTYTGSNVTLNASGANALIQSGPRNSGDGLSSTFTIQARTVVYGANFATDGTNLVLNGGGGISDGTFGLARKGDVILTPGWNNYFPGADNRAAQNGSVVFNVGNNSPEVFRCSNVIGAGGAVATFAFNGATVAAGNTFQVGTGGSNGNGASLTTGGTWTNGSSRNFKERFTSLNGSDVLSKISGLNVLGWYYKGTNEYHIGPIAEEFYAAFNTGNQTNPSQTEKYISSVDPAGVALVGIKELVKQNEEQAARIKALEEKLERLEKLLVK